MASPASPDPSPPAPDPSAAGEHSFLELLGARPVAFAQGRGRLELDVQPRHLRSLGLVHGGVIATLLDSVMGMAAGSLAPPDHYVVTVGLNVHFIRPCRQGETLVATAEVVHSGRQTAVARGEIHTGSGALVAGGSATFLHLPHAGRARDPIGSGPGPGTEG